MDRKLVLSRSLNDSQKRHALKIGIDPTVYQQHVINRLEEMHAATRPKTFRDPKNVRTRITAQNPILIVGDGPSSKKNMEKIRNFKGKIICFDVNLIRLIRHGIIPDFIVTMEIKATLDLFESKYLVQCKDKSKLIGSAITQPNILEHARDNGVSQARWISTEEPRFSNVGTFGINYAIEVLECDKVFIIGFEHDGVAENEMIYEYWKTDFWYFLQKWPKGTIVNCTDGGQLYYNDYILDSTLDSLVVM